MDYNPPVILDKLLGENIAIHDGVYFYCVTTFFFFFFSNCGSNILLSTR